MSSFGKYVIVQILFGWIKAKYQLLDLSELKQTCMEQISVKSGKTVKYGINSFKSPKIMKVWEQPYFIIRTWFKKKKKKKEKKFGERGL